MMQRRGEDAGAAAISLVTDLSRIHGGAVGMCDGMPSATVSDAMAKRVLAWVRHGEYAQPPGVPSAHLPHGLTPRGREQALEAARVVWQYAGQQGLELDAVVDCSRLRRAWETADVMARELERLGSSKLVVSELDALMERGLGAATNLSLEQIEAVLAADPRFEPPPPGWRRDAHYILPLPGAESLAQAGERVARHVRARMRALAGASTAAGSMLVLFVGHGGAFRHAAGQLGMLSAADVQRLSMQHGAPIFFEFHPGSAADPSAERWLCVAGDWRERGAGAARRTPRHARSTQAHAALGDEPYAADARTLRNR
jgi:2,3-bisphosphoglycerate-dependent phosphoglycerate mutase